MRSLLPPPVERLGRAGLDRLVPPPRRRYRWLRRETPQAHLDRHGLGDSGRVETVHPARVAHHPLPGGVTDRDELPRDAGWWGYSMHDVPARRESETFVATLPRCRVAWYGGAGQPDEFHPAIIGSDGASIELSQIRFRPQHAPVLRDTPPRAHLARATWVLERVYDNHSHWLTAHLPKLLLLAERDQLDDVVLPAHLGAAAAQSLEMLSVEVPGRLDLSTPGWIDVDELTVIGTDRFRSSLLRSVQEASGATAAAGHRRIWVSRDRATRRRLRDEAALRPVLDHHGFEIVHLEDMSFADQLALMRQTAVLAGPHGAGLTNMIFCPPGTHVVEIAAPDFPNPNFYAEAAGLGHRYWYVPARSVGDGPSLERDLQVDPSTLATILGSLEV